MLHAVYNCARCCPSRASLLTGLYPHQAGVGGMTVDQGKPAYRGFLQPNTVTLAGGLWAAGYRILMCGKWHLSLGPGRPPTAVERIPPALPVLAGTGTPVFGRNRYTGGRPTGNRLCIRSQALS